MSAKGHIKTGPISSTYSITSLLITLISVIFIQYVVNRLIYPLISIENSI